MIKLIVDTNILFTFFWKNSISKILFLHPKLTLYSPEFSLEELNKYQNLILKKTKITKTEFKKLKKELAQIINFIELSRYSLDLKDAKKISPDPNDVDFVALSLNLNCPIWSNDKELANQNNFEVITTSQIIELLAD